MALDATNTVATISPTIAGFESTWGIFSSSIPNSTEFESVPEFGPSSYAFYGTDIRVIIIIVGGVGGFVFLLVCGVCVLVCIRTRTRDSIRFPMQPMHPSQHIPL